MIKLWLGQVPPRGLVLLAILMIALLVAPFVVDSYTLSVLIIVFYFAYLGQAWNIMMGFAGQLSLGHALYFGVGAYTSAALFVHFGVSPWFGMLAGGLLAALVGAFIGFLGFRFKIGGVYFAILTIAFAEFTRILVDHIGWLGGSGGFFLPVANRTTNDVWALRGAPVMFYYIWFAASIGVLVLCRALLSSRLGYFWMAIREDEEAAQALGINTFRYKILAVVLSASLTAFGGTLYAFYNNNLFPGPIFSIARSIDMLLGAIIGGVGTLMGPIVGAFILTPLGEGLTLLIEEFKSSDARVDGIKQVFYGICVVLIVVFQRRGVWPYFSRKLGLGGKEDRS